MAASAAPVTLASLLLSPSLALAASLAPPNFVLHFIDDTGYGDYGFNVPTDDTPRLPAAAQRGGARGGRLLRRAGAPAAGRR